MERKRISTALTAKDKGDIKFSTKVVFILLLPLYLPLMFYLLPDA